ncbi:MAG: hypothetical protein IKQ99_03465, partial [Alphaproteobacteria bacterium]|nr:hypothetical protein [Alphaproteobacteria bacterium]
MNNSATPPQNPNYAQTQAPAAPNSGNGDLYDEITKEDEEVVSTPIKKKRQTPFMFLVVCFMKITFYFDSVKRSHESFFHFLSGIWAGFMALIYLGGIITLFLSIYARMRLPLELENFFESHNLKYESLKMADYSLSKINVFNLHDDEGKYLIPQLNIHSTFADFLQGRIRTVTAEGLKLNLKQDGSSENGLENVLGVLGMMANPMEMGLDFKINAISIKNAVLYIEGRGTSIPVNFSMSGLYTKDSQVIIPFAVNENFLKMEASLTISGDKSDRKLDLTINSGKLTLENRPPEDMQGNVTIQLSEDKVTDVKSKLNLNYGHSLKIIETALNNKDNGFDGTLSFVYKNTAEKDADLKPLANLFFNFKDLKITQDGKVETTAPLQVKINRLIYNSALLEGVNSDLKGQLKCSLKEGECNYTLEEQVKTFYSKITVKYKGQNVEINEAGSLLFRPTQNTFFFKLADSEVALNWNLSEVNLAGFYNTPTNFLNLKTDSLQMVGHFWDDFQRNSLDINVREASYKTPFLEMEGINLQAENLMDETSPVSFSARNIQTSSTLLTQPVSVNLTYTNRQIKADISVDNSDVKLTAEGVFKPFQKVFVGQFRLPPVDLAELPFMLSELSPLFSKKITNLSGKVMAMGQLNFSGSTNIGGPLYIGLKDVSFNFDGTEIQKVNSVIALQSLAPLVSAPKQTISIGTIKSQVPLTNIIGS